jgi:Lar family restriction alleviation protein
MTVMTTEELKAEDALYRHLEKNLKPCPFCGSTDVHLNGDDRWNIVICLGCGANGGADLGISGAAEVWNQRAEVQHDNS